MEALILLVVLVVLFLLLRFFRTGRVKFSSQLKQCADHRSLMIILKDDIQSSLSKKHWSESFEKALVLLGLYDRLIALLQDHKFMGYLKDPRNDKGARLLQSLSTTDLEKQEKFLETHGEELKQTYVVGLGTLMQLNQQLNLSCDLKFWNRPSAKDQKQLPETASLHPAVKNMLEQRLLLCQLVVELSMLLLRQNLQQVLNESHNETEDTSSMKGAGAVMVSPIPQVPASFELAAITQKDEPNLELQQLYTKYQKILSLVLSTERVSCLHLRLLSLLPTCDTKVSTLVPNSKNK